MSKYKGIPCPICGKAFTDEDDIVVCPDCGAPYHRDCYNEKGACIFDDLHAKHEDWQMPKANQADYEVKDTECPRCGTLNAKSAYFCSRCGLPLGTNQVGQNNNPNPYQNYYNPTNNNANVYNNYNNFNNPNGTVYNPFDPMGGVNPTDYMDQDITYGEASKVVQQNTRYYMPAFKRLKNTNSSKFNFAAFLFSGGWFLYRKMYKQGIIASVIWLVLYLARALVSLKWITPFSVSLSNSLSSDATMQETYQLMAEKMASSPSVVYASWVVMALTVAMIVFMIICGKKANRLYMKHCEDTIHESRNHSNGDNAVYEEAITLKGGTNTIVALVVTILYVALSNLVNFL